MHQFAQKVNAPITSILPSIFSITTYYAQTPEMTIEKIDLSSIIRMQHFFALKTHIETTNVSF